MTDGHKVIEVDFFLLGALLMAQLVKESAYNAGDPVDSWVGKILWRRDGLPTPVAFLVEPPVELAWWLGTVKNPPATTGDLSLIPEMGRSLETGKATSNILAWRIPLELYSLWGRKGRTTTEYSFLTQLSPTKMQEHNSMVCTTQAAFKCSNLSNPHEIKEDRMKMH